MMPLFHYLIGLMPSPQLYILLIGKQLLCYETKLHLKPYFVKSQIISNYKNLDVSAFPLPNRITPISFNQNPSHAYLLDILKLRMLTSA